MLHDLPLVPLIDVALTLLIIFMLTSPMIQNAIKVELPHGKINEAGQGTNPAEMIVYVDRQNKLFLDGTLYKPEELLATVKQRVGTHTDKIVVVKADRESAYGPVMELVDTMKGIGGLKYVLFGTTKQRA
jgi:biopolymer transport protein ExbD